MGAVDIRIGHDDDLVIAELLEVELVADSGAERRDDRRELVVAIDLVGPGLFHVQHLAPERQDGLEPRIASLRGGAAGGVALDDVDFGQRRVGVVAVAELVRHLSGLETGLAPDGLARLARGLACAAGRHGLVENGLADSGIFLEEHRQLLRHDRVHERPHRRIAELGLRLALKLRIRQLDGDDGGQSLADVIAAELIVVFEIALLDAVGIQHVRQRPLEALLVHAALRRMDVVRK